jgi:hypothetical protein
MIHSHRIVDNLDTLRVTKRAQLTTCIFDRAWCARSTTGKLPKGYEPDSISNQRSMRSASRESYSGTLANKPAVIPLNQRLFSAEKARRLQYFDDAFRLASRLVASRLVASRRCAVCCGIARRAILATFLLCYLKRQRPWTSPLSSASPAWRPDIRLPVPQSPWTCSWGS